MADTCLRLLMPLLALVFLPSHLLASPRWPIEQKNIQSFGEQKAPKELYGTEFGEFSQQQQPAFPLYFLPANIPLENPMDITIPQNVDGEDQVKAKRAQTFVRFGKRAQMFVRFGKRAQTFVRFGRDVREGQGQSQQKLDQKGN